MRGKVTIQQIADHVGLSKFAVSRALSGKPGVSVQTRDMIIKTASQLGYVNEQPLPASVSDPGDQEARVWSGTILVLFPNVRSQNKESLYWGPIFEGISSALSKKNINIVTLTEPNDDSMFSLLNPEAIMGMITVGFVSTAILFNSRRLGIPVVMVDHLDPDFQCDTIFTDNLTGMRSIMSAMLRKGYKKYQFVGNIKDAQSYYERWLAFNIALQENGIVHSQIPELIEHELSDFHLTLEKAFKSNERPEVFICANDFYARHTIEAFERLGNSITDQAVITGFDNTNPPPLSKATVNVDEELLGRRAVDQMLWRILNPNSSYEKKLIHGELILHD